MVVFIQQTHKRKRNHRERLYILYLFRHSWICKRAWHQDGGPLLMPAAAA